MKYEDYALDLGFTKEDNVFYMEHNGFIIYLKDWQYSMLNIPSFYIPLNESLDKEFIKEIEHIALDNVCSVATLEKEMDTLIVSLADGNKKQVKTQSLIKKQIEEVTKALKEEGYKKMELCPICHKEAKYMLFGDNYCPMHIECRKEFINKLKEKSIEEKGFNPKYVLAIILSLLGALIGLTPALILAILNYDYYFGGMICLTPILATLGYFLAKAPSRKWLKITVGIIVLVVVIAFLAFAIPYMANGKGLALNDYMFSNGFIGTRRLVLGLLLGFGGFGGMKFLDKFKKNTNKELEKFKNQE